MGIVYGYLTSTGARWLLAFQLFSAASMIQVHAQPPDGFLSIDCGYTNSDGYVDKNTTLPYVSDEGYVEGGKSFTILAQYMKDATNKQEETLRSFPDGRRNCYTLPNNSSKKYLIRATFTYGNYDGLQSSKNGSLFLFGLHIGVNFWTTVNLTNWSPSDTVWKEVITVAPDTNISVCLINLGSGTPFISTLDLRKLDDAMFTFLNRSVSISYFARKRFGSVDDYITRYPTDPFDRFWEAAQQYSFPWINLTTTRTVNRLPGNDDFQLPTAILQKASTINSNFSWLNITVTATDNIDYRSLELLPIFHFAEIDGNSPNRTFDIYSDENLMFPSYTPPPFRVDSTYNKSQFLRKTSAYFTLGKTPSSELPPLINAFEVYSLVRMDNPTTSSDDDKAKKNTATLLIVVIVPLVAIILVLILWMLFCKGKSKEYDDYDMYEEETPLHTDTRRFTYKELKIITNNFQSIIGKGGFGTVYHGILENGEEVAVKVLRETSIALSKDFLPEVQTLSKVHHKNLVTFLGYCQNKKCLALVYDFMPRGNLHEVLRGEQEYSLSWEERLHIALHAAQGLEYLHESCTPAIVHRDVKTANILLDENLVATISDFGLSRSYTPAHTHISTVAAGTVGYLDPEYHATFQLTVKADVYSFGIVLLEIITGQPSVLVDPEPVHLPNWVRQKIAKGCIHDAVDSRLMHQYDATSLQSVIDLAMSCVENASIDRPSMTDIVIKLKECLPVVTGEKQLVSGSYKHKDAMDADIARQFQLLISGVSIESTEGTSSGITELSNSGR